MRKEKYMELRKLLLSSCLELDNGVTPAVPVDCLENWAIKRSISLGDFSQELDAALHDGDLEITSPGMIGMTKAGTQRYAENFL